MAELVEDIADADMYVEHVEQGVECREDSEL